MRKVLKHNRLFGKWRGGIGTRGHIDAIAGRRVSGWAFASSQVTIEASIDGKTVLRSGTGAKRPDVAAAFDGDQNALSSGFTVNLSQIVVPEDGVVNVTIAARPTGANSSTKVLGHVKIAGDIMVRSVANAPESGIVGPFPRGVTDIIAKLWPDACGDLRTSAGQAMFVEKLGILLQVPELRTVPEISRYARYLRATIAHCNFVDRYFPAINENSVDDRPDFHCKPNSIRELFSIINHLYVLKSYGVEGDFAEFGCFKGFSSSMLSFACRELGIKMHIFDSFEGLPPAEGSGYSAGDYAGSLEEVRAHVTRFGAVDSVEFHKGFFEDTFRGYRPPPLMCIWMDVDIESSARDLMVVADRLDPRGGLFSHECTSEIFQGDVIVREPRKDNPVPPVLDRFEALGLPLAGRFIAGNTGSFWPRASGVPVLDPVLLHELVEKVL